jgi:hypothetical protein
MADSTTKDSIVAAVIVKFAQRSALGIKKYGTTLDRTDLTTKDWIQHTQEELMDAILYLEKLKQVTQLAESAESAESASVKSDGKSS